MSEEKNQFSRRSFLKSAGILGATARAIGATSILYTKTDFWRNFYSYFLASI